ncbi:MAG: beta strand repeat-containing protein, partial [Bacteroidota bacterium]
SSLAEGTAGTIPYNIVLPAGVTPVLTVGGTATNGSDFTYSITANGITVTPSADGIYDPNETIIFTLTGMLGNAVLGTIKTHTVTLTEPQLVVEFTEPTSSLAEGNSGSVPFNQTLPAAVTPTITFGGTATQGTDYTSTVTQSGINITVLADGQLDADETIVLTIAGVTGNATTGITNTHTVTLNDPPIEVNFATASSTVQEGNAGTINYNLTLPAGVTPTASFSGTATEGVDFTYTITQTGITITTVADGNYEPNETIIVTLTGVSGNAVLGSAVTHTMTINEPALVVQFASATSTVSEGNTFTIPFNFTLPEAVIPVITTAGTATLNTDYTYSVTASGIVVNAITDVIDDPNETAIFTITGVSGNAVLGATVANTMTITLAPVVVEFQAAASTVQEGSQTTVSYTAALPPGVTPIVSIGGTATQGSDYTYTIGQNGISIQTTTDALYEPSETIVITITGVNGNATTGTLLTHTVTINDPPLSVGFAAATSTLLEGATATVGYTTTLPAEVVPTISFGGTATQGTDYSITLTPAGIQISALEEWAADPNETITITLQSVSGNAQLGTTTVHTVTLTDPAAPAIGFTSASSAGNEGQTLNVPFNQSLPAGVTPSITVTGNAVPATDYSYSVTQTGLTIQLFSDALADGTETISFTITGFNTNGAEFGTIVQHTVTVNDIAFVTGFAAATSTVTEGSSGTVTFESPIPAGVNPTFSFTGKATAGADYTYTVTASGITVTTI